MDYLDFRISLTEFCRYIFLHVIVMDCCFSSLIRLSKYRDNHSMSHWGINFSGIHWIIENVMFSSLLCSLWEISLIGLLSLISISIIISPFFLSFYIYMIPSKRKIYNIQDKNSANYFFNIRGNLLNFCVFISRKVKKISIKFPEKVEIKIQ